MAAIYAALIKKELKTLEDVPDKLKEAVQKILDGDTAVSYTHLCTMQLRTAAPHRILIFGRHPL